MKILIRSIKSHGKTRWRLDYFYSGKRCQPSYPTKQEAEQRKSLLLNEEVSANGAWAMMDNRERDALILAYHKSKQSGHVLADLISRANELKPHVGPSLGETVTELIASKRNAGRSEEYLSALKWILDQFSNGRTSQKIDAILLSDVEKFLDAKSINSRSTLRARLSTLFKFAVRRGYRADNPCARLEAVTVSRRPPEIFTVEQFKKAVKWLRKNTPECLTWFVLSSVCGLRPQEAEKTRKEDIHIREGFIRVEAQTTKVRQRRVVYPKTEAMKLLEWSFKKGNLPLNPQWRKRMIAGCPHPTKKGVKRSQGLRDVLGFSVWPKDITRHTAASYWLASGESASHVAEMLGHSEKTLKAHYKALVTRKEAETFWRSVSSLIK